MSNQQVPGTDMPVDARLDITHGLSKEIARI